MAAHGFSSHHHSYPLPLVAGLRRSKAVLIKAFLLPRIAYHRKAFRLKSIPLPIKSGLSHSFSLPFAADPCNSKAVSSRCLPLPFRCLSSRLCGMQFLRISMLFPAEQFLCRAAHFQCVSLPLCSSAMQGVAWPFQRLYVGNQQIRLAICSTVKSRKLP